MDPFLLIPDAKNIKLHKDFEISSHRIVSVLCMSLISMKLYQEEIFLYYVLILGIRLSENMPGMILIYWCHFYHFISTEQNEAKLARRIS